MLVLKNFRVAHYLTQHGKLPVVKGLRFFRDIQLNNWNYETNNTELDFSTDP